MSFSQAFLWRRFLGVLILVWVGTVLWGAEYTFGVLPPIYMAHADVEVEDSRADPSLQSEMERLNSAEFLLPVIHDLDLDKIWAKRVYESGPAALPDKTSLAYLRRVLDARVVPGTRVIRIRVSSEVPDETAQVANEIADRLQVMESIDKPSTAIRILSRAEVPKHSTLPNHLVNLTAAAFKGIPLGLFVAVLVEWTVWYVASCPRRVITTPYPSEDY